MCFSNSSWWLPVWNGHLDSPETSLMMSEFPTRCCSERLRSTLPFPSSIPWRQKFSLTISVSHFLKVCIFPPYKVCFAHSKSVLKHNLSVSSQTNERHKMCLFVVASNLKSTLRTTEHNKPSWIRNAKMQGSFWKKKHSWYSAFIFLTPFCWYCLETHKCHLICWFSSMSTYRECYWSNFETWFFWSGFWNIKAKDNLSKQGSGFVVCLLSVNY